MIATRFLSKAALALAIGGVAGGAVVGGFTITSALSGASASSGANTSAGSATPADSGQLTTTASEADLASMADPAAPTQLAALTAGASSTAPPAAGNHPHPQDLRDLRGRLVRRVEHGEFVVRGKDGKPVDVVVQRGLVTAVSPTSVTVKSADGYTAAYPISTATRVRVDGSKQSIANVKVGNKIGVVAKKVNGALETGIVIARS